MNEFEAVVVGNGEFPVHPFPLTVLDQSPCVVCCDGGDECTGGKRTSA